MVTETTVQVEETTTTREQFNWLKVLTALANGEISVVGGSVLWIQLVNRAKDWPTCACGQLCKRLPHRGNGGPADNELYMEGSRFYGLVQSAAWANALKCFERIEERATWLLR